MSEFLNDIEGVRKRACDHISEGAVTDGYRADRAAVISVLNDVLATETVCALRYRRHYFTAEGIASEAVKAEFLEHAHEGQDHADRVA